MTIQLINNSAAQQHKSLRSTLCRHEESAIMVDSASRAYMSSWFINLPVIDGGPG